MLNAKQLPNAIRFALLAGAASTMGIANNAIAQDEAATLDRIEVTGSRIKRADIEGALPVTVIDRQQLELSGDTSVADYLRNTTFNSFGSFRPQSGSSAQSFAGLSLRGLGTGRTLILIDGRRAPIAPNVGSAQDLNSIPLAAVERIEILSDGASAIYGTDAIGGVVNIITRKDFSGVEMSVGMSNPKRPGGETEEASVIFGAASDRGRLMAGASYNNRGIIFQRERPWSTGGDSVFSNNFAPATPAPGTLYGFTPGAFLEHPEFGSSVPGGCADPAFFEVGTGVDRRCLYDFTALAADEAEIRNNALFVRGDYQINDDWMTYFNAGVTRVKSFGRYAPVPSSPWPGGQPFIPVGSPNHPGNPNGFNAGNTAGYDPDAPVFLRHRFAAGGPRDSFVDSNVYDVMVGAEGRIGNFDIDFGVRRNEFKYIDLGYNYVVGGLAQQAIADGTYNIYDPSGNSADVINSFTTTISRNSSTVLQEVFVSAATDLWEMGGGSAGLAVGLEYRSEDYADIYDSLSGAGQVVGSAGNSAAGGRNVRAGFFEVLLPFTSQFEVGVAGRYDRYSDYGSDFSPKVSLRYQPLDTLTLRASYSEGFRAPSLDILTQQPSFSADGTNDPQTCQAFTGDPECSTQVTAYVIANPDLESEQSEQWSVGLAWDATDWLNLTLDYYDITITNRIAGISTLQIRNCLAGVSTNCPSGLSNLPVNVQPPQPELGLGLARDPNSGAILYVQRGFTNLGTLDTSGMDLNVRTNFDFAGAGSLRNQLQVSYVRDYSVDGGESIIGEPGIPKYRANLNNQYGIGDFTFAWNVNYIHSTLTVAGLSTGEKQRSWTTHDLQASWNAPWNGRVTVGATNITDKDPPLDPAYGRGFDFNLYDGYGRVPYIRYTQSF